MTPRAITQSILAEVAAKHGVTVGELIGRGKPRGKHLRAARTEAVSRLRGERGMTYQRIGEALGNRDPATVRDYLLGRIDLRLAYLRAHSMQNANIQGEPAC